MPQDVVWLAAQGQQTPGLSQCARDLVHDPAWRTGNTMFDELAKCGDAEPVEVNAEGCRDRPHCRYLKGGR